MSFLKAHWKISLICILSLALIASGYLQIKRAWNDGMLNIAKDAYQKGTQDTVSAIFQRAKVGEVSLSNGTETLILIPKP